VLIIIVLKKGGSKEDERKRGEKRRRAEDESCDPESRQLNRYIAKASFSSTVFKHA